MKPGAALEGLRRVPAGGEGGEPVAQFIVDTISRLGYLGLFGLMFLETLFPPIPSELVMPFAGMAATRGTQLNFWWVIVWGTAGSVLGAVLLYFLGAKIGIDRARQWTEKYGVWIGVSPEDIDKGREWFSRHGGITVLFCRLIPGVRSVISIPAGVERMNFAAFLAYTTLGSAAWTGLLAYAGRILGHNYHQVEQYLNPVSWVVVSGIVTLWAYRVARKKLRGSAQRRQPA